MPYANEDNRSSHLRMLRKKRRQRRLEAKRRRCDAISTGALRTQLEKSTQEAEGLVNSALVIANAGGDLENQLPSILVAHQIISDAQNSHKEHADEIAASLLTKQYEEYIKIFRKLETDIVKLTRSLVNDKTAQACSLLEGEDAPHKLFDLVVHEHWTSVTTLLQTLRRNLLISGIVNQYGTVHRLHYNLVSTINELWAWRPSLYISHSRICVPTAPGLLLPHIAERIIETSNNNASYSLYSLKECMIEVPLDPQNKDQVEALAIICHYIPKLILHGKAVSEASFEALRKTMSKVVNTCTIDLHPPKDNKDSAAVISFGCELLTDFPHITQLHASYGLRLYYGELIIHSANFTLEEEIIALLNMLQTRGSSIPKLVICETAGGFSAEQLALIMEAFQGKTIKLRMDASTLASGRQYSQMPSLPTTLVLNEINFQAGEIAGLANCIAAHPGLSALHFLNCRCPHELDLTPVLNAISAHSKAVQINIVNADPFLPLLHALIMTGKIVRVNLSSYAELQDIYPKLSKSVFASITNELPRATIAAIFTTFENLYSSWGGHLDTNVQTQKVRKLFHHSLNQPYRTRQSKPDFYPTLLGDWQAAKAIYSVAELTFAKAGKDVEAGVYAAYNTYFHDPNDPNDPGVDINKLIDILCEVPANSPCWQTAQKEIFSLSKHEVHAYVSEAKTLFANVGWIARRRYNNQGKCQRLLDQIQASQTLKTLCSTLEKFCSSNTNKKIRPVVEKLATLLSVLRERQEKMQSVSSAPASSGTYVALVGATKQQQAQTLTAATTTTAEKESARVLRAQALLAEAPSLPIDDLDSEHTDADWDPQVPDAKTPVRQACPI